MCYIEIQYFLHCKHVEAYFRDCWDGPRRGVDDGRDVVIPEGYTDHENSIAMIHAFERPCDVCLGDALDVVALNEQLQETEPSITYAGNVKQLRAAVCDMYGTALAIMQQRRTLNEIDDFPGHKPFSCNVDFRKAPFNGNTPMMLFGSPVDHDAALRADRKYLTNEPKCQEGPGLLNESARMILEDNSEALMNDERFEKGLTRGTKEIVVHFGECQHINVFFCPTISQPTPGNPTYSSECGCVGYDVKLRSARYADSEQSCLVCRWDVGQFIYKFDGERMGHFRALVRSDIPAGRWHDWGNKVFEQYMRNDIKRNEWLRWPGANQRDLVDLR